MVYWPLASALPLLPFDSTSSSESSNPSQDSTLFTSRSDGLIWQNLWGGLGDPPANGSGADEEFVAGDFSGTQQDVSSDPPQDPIVGAGGASAGSGGAGLPQALPGSGDGGTGTQGVGPGLPPDPIPSADAGATGPGGLGSSQVFAGASGNGPATPSSVGVGSPQEDAGGSTATTDNLTLLTNFMASSFPQAGTPLGSASAPIALPAIEPNVAVGALQPLPQAHG